MNSPNNTSLCDRIINEIPIALYHYRVSGYDDHEIVKKLAFLLEDKLKEGRRLGCPNIRERIIEVTIKALNSIGIDRYNFMFVNLIGLSREVREMLYEIFPPLRPGYVEFTQPRVEAVTVQAPHEVNSTSNTGAEDLSTYNKCFIEGLFELEEFIAKYMKYGRLGFEDWQVVSEVSSIVSTMLREGKERKCQNLKELIIHIIETELRKAGINRYAISNAYLHGMDKETREIIEALFPGATQITRPSMDELNARLGHTDIIPRLSPEGFENTPSTGGNIQPHGYGPQDHMPNHMPSMPRRYPTRWGVEPQHNAERQTSLKSIIAMIIMLLILSSIALYELLPLELFAVTLLGIVGITMLAIVIINRHIKKTHSSAISSRWRLTLEVLLVILALIALYALLPSPLSIFLIFLIILILWISILLIERREWRRIRL